MSKVSRRSFLRALGLTGVASAVAGLVTGCGSASSPAASQSGAGAASDKKVVNIGSTGGLTTLNPLLVDATWINMYACMLQFRPLVIMDDNEGFLPGIADRIETEDNLTYTIHIDDKAAWSDGTPVSADDLIYTLWALSSAKVGNLTMSLVAIEGVDDTIGYRAEGVDSLDGVQKVDEKTISITFKWAMSPNVFKTGYAQYIYVVPKHKLESIPEDQLATTEWFNTPEVVSGPYICTDKDNDHYISYKANEAYWLGAPQIPLLNIKVVDGAQLLSGLQSGEIDVVPPLLGTINQEDYNTVLNLPGVTAQYGSRYAVESLFINCNNIPEKEIRQALLCGLDRATIVAGLLNGEGDLYDGFAVPAGPYNKGLEATAFDAGKAAALVDAAKGKGWNAGKVYELYLNSGDNLLIQACTVAQQFWAAVGLNVNLNTVDLSTLMTMCIEGSGDMYGVQYTYPPTDPSFDIQWVLPYWCFYDSQVVADGVAQMWNAADEAAYADALYAIDQDVKENVPFINLYVNGPLGAVSNRIQGAKVQMYGCLANVETWTIAE